MQIQINKGNRYNITYKDARGTVSNKEIIALTETPKNIVALDITSLEEADKWWIDSMQQEYQKYVDTHMANMFKFEEWLEHTHMVNPESLAKIKYKRFTTNNIKIIDK